MKKLVRDRDTGVAGASTSRLAWKVLLVDDEPDVRAVTRLCLRDFVFASRGLEILEAGSAAEARQVLAAHPDIAMALIDVVMETDDAGLKLVEYIRDEQRNAMIRLIIRTGQPGMAPERWVIDHYDIDDYKDKSELSATRLYTTVRTAIKAFRDLQAIDLNRAGLAQLLRVAPEIYRLGDHSVAEFFQGVLTQVVGLCNLSEAGILSTIDGLVATIDEADVTVQAALGGIDNSPRFEEIKRQCLDVVLNRQEAERLRNDSLVVPLTNEGAPAGYIYLESTRPLSPEDMALIRLMGQQCSSAFENLRLHADLRESFGHAIDMLAEVAEFKDKTTGDHVARIGEYTRLLAVEMGIPEDEAAVYGEASRLHDVGKVGIADDILHKPGPLVGPEVDAIRSHPEIGAAVLGHDKSFDLAREIALGHHERWDGKGYPREMPSRLLPLAARIVTVVDVFDALVSVRPYKKSWTPDRAAQAIEQGAGSQFDPDVVQAFMALYRRGVFAPLIQRCMMEAQVDR